MTMPQDSQAIERRAIAKVSWRLLPLVALAYCIAYIDRSNILPHGRPATPLPWCARMLRRQRNRESRSC